MSFQVFELQKYNFTREKQKYSAIFFVFHPKSITFAPEIEKKCACGEIGRRARLRIWYFTVWGFES
ncbi:MAG: hypothetical protein Q4D23_00670, partial [Bacteroidales bacterium]|nr:hypothetical protein [Bacteroidales bacterium]